MRTRPSIRRASLIGAAFGIVLAGCDGPADTTQLIDQARARQAAGELDAAIIELMNAVKADPQNDTARTLLVEASIDRAAEHRGAEDLRASIATLEKALRRDRDNARIKAQLVMDYLALAEQAATEGDTATRVGALKGAIKTAPDNAEARSDVIECGNDSAR